jgi:hypothetical protein
MGPEAVKLAWNYGLGIVLAVAIALFLGWLIRYVLRENAKREDRLAGIIENHLHALDESTHKLTNAITEHDRASREGYRQQHEEHREIVKLLERLNNGG